MHQLLEFEELAGKYWHRWASAASSYPEHADAVVRFDEISEVLGVFFRAAGGNGGLGVGAIAPRESGHRLSLRQRLGFDREVLDQTRLDDESLLLPPAVALFPNRSLNRDVYFWLAAHAAVLEPFRIPQDPLQADILALRAARLAAARVCRELPGLGQRYRRLCAALLILRPDRHLPTEENALELAILSTLAAGAGDESFIAEPETAQASERACATATAEEIFRLANHSSAPVDQLQAPGNYRSPLPVPLWAISHCLSRREAGAEPDDEAQVNAPVEDNRKAGKRKAVRKQQDQAERDDSLIFNRFEKMLSFAEMVNVNRMVDDEEDEDASKAADQLEEITLSPHQQQAAARLRMDLDLPMLEVSGGAARAEITYPEWNYRQRAMLPAQCTVLAGRQEPDGDAWDMDAKMKQRVQRVRRQFEALRPRRVLMRGQLDGSELDIDAVVRAHADRIAFGGSDDRLFADARTIERDLAVSILVDVSLSTEAWLEDRRVIDVEKEALLVLAHGLQACGDEYAIHSFTSKRRDKVWVNAVKEFKDPLDTLVERRIAALKPGHYTRMGAAIRHLTSGLAGLSKRHRLLLVLTDGKPNDTDYYEGRYALEDTRHAVREARRAGVRVFAVTIDRESQAYFPRVFGRGGYAVVYRPEHLATALPAIYRQLVAQ